MTVRERRREEGATNRSTSRGRRGTYAEAAAGPPPQLSQGQRPGAPQPSGGRPALPGGPLGGARTQQRPTLRRPPKMAAVQVSCPLGQIAESMKLAREKINLKSLGIGELRPRRARTRALLLEVLLKLKILLT